MPKVKVNDINIYYEIHGDGFPFIMIRGLGSNIDWWDPVFLEAMSKEKLIQIVTDDGDFATVSGIRVFTANKNVITAAQIQGKLVTR